MRFLCYFYALCIRIKKVLDQRAGLKCVNVFEICVKFQIKTYFSASVQRNDYIILVLTIIVVSTDMKRVSRKCING